MISWAFVFSISNCSEASLRHRLLLAGGFRHFFLGPVQFFQAHHLVLGILQSQMGICVHGDANVRITHQVLQCLWIHAGAGHVAALPAPAPNGRVAGLVDCVPGEHFVGDIADKTVLEAFAQDVIRRFDRVDVLVNNAPPLFKGLDECTYE